MSTSLRILESYIRELFLLERRRNKKKRNRKPGGPRSDIGALRQLNTDAFATKVKGAVNAAGGDVPTAASKLDVAPRTLYGYLEDPSLDSVVTTSDKSDEKKLPRDTHLLINWLGAIDCFFEIIANVRNCITFIYKCFNYTTFYVFVCNSILLIEMQQ